MRVDKEAGTSSNFMYRKPGPIPMPSPTAPPISILRLTMSALGVSFMEPRIPLSGMGGYRPKGSMGALSVYPAIKVPIGPLPVVSLHTPILASRFRLGGPIGTPPQDTKKYHIIFKIGLKISMEWGILMTI